MRWHLALQVNNSALGQQKCKLVHRPEAAAFVEKWQTTGGNALAAHSSILALLFPKRGAVLARRPHALDGERGGSPQPRCPATKLCVPPSHVWPKRRQSSSVPTGSRASTAVKGSTGVMRPLLPSHNSSAWCAVQGETGNTSPPTPGISEVYCSKLHPPPKVFQFSGQNPPSAITDFKHQGSQLD